MARYDDQVPGRHQHKQIYTNEMLNEQQIYQNRMAHLVNNDLASKKDIT
jgi:hypothetical protein